MHFKSHIKMADFILMQTSEFLPDRFSRFMFRLGSVIPDISWLILVHPHFAKKSLDYIETKIEKLQMQTSYGAYSSMQMGIIVHYLADFCCYTHNRKHIDTYRQHSRYESELQRYLLDNVSIFMEKYTAAEEPTLGNNWETRSLIEGYLQDHRQGGAGFAWDIEKAVEVGAAICISAFCFARP